MFSETNYMEQDSSKNCLASLKLIVFLNICSSYYEYKKARVRNIIPSLY